MTAAYYAASAAQAPDEARVHAAVKHPTITVAGALAEHLIGVVEGFTHQSIHEPDLGDLTEEILRFADAVEATLREKGIELVLQLQCRRITAVSRLRFGQALRVLLGHAERSLAAVREERRKAITISTKSHDDRVFLHFADNGCGQAPELLPPAMDVGTRFWVEATVGCGTTVHVLLPVSL